MQIMFVRFANNNCQNFWWLYFSGQESLAGFGRRLATWRNSEREYGGLRRPNLNPQSLVFGWVLLYLVVFGFIYAEACNLKPLLNGPDKRGHEEMGRDSKTKGRHQDGHEARHRHDWYMYIGGLFAQGFYVQGLYAAGVHLHSFSIFVIVTSIVFYHNCSKLVYLIVFDFTSVQSCVIWWYICTTLYVIYCCICWYQCDMLVYNGH